MHVYTFGLYVDTCSSHAHALQSIGIGGFVYTVEVIYYGMLYNCCWYIVYIVHVFLLYIHWCRYNYTLLEVGMDDTTIYILHLYRQ